MGIFTRMIYMVAAMVAVITAQGYADEPVPVTPPFQQPQEEWVLTYTNYKNGAQASRDMVIVRDDSELYIKGVFAEYPESWIKGTVDNTTLRLVGVQYFGMNEDNEDVYFYCGAFDTVWSSGNTYVYEDKTFTPKTGCGVFTIAENGSKMTPVEKDASFWYTGNPSGEVKFWKEDTWYDSNREEYAGRTGTGFPDVDYMLNMVFSKKGESGIEDTVADTMYDLTAPMYDLQGRMVNPESARPGIYIRNGKKIVK